MSTEKSNELGGRLRHLREIRNISLRYLAQESGLSANALSMIERGMSSPSVSTLYKLADALELPVTAFFGDQEEAQQIIFVRAKQGARLPIVGGFWEGRGGERFAGRVEPFVLTLDIGADSGPAPMLHTGHEFVYCLAGTLEYQVEGQTYILNPGDSLLFAAHLSHRWRNAGSITTKLLLVLSGFEQSDHPLSVHIKQ